MRWALLLAALAAAGGGVRSFLSQPPLCPGLPHRCSLVTYGQNEYTYTVDGLDVQIEYTDGGYFALNCPETLTLDNSALPRFESELRVNKVQLTDCPPPRESYAAVLRALNVTVLDKLKLNRAGRLAPAHLAGLQRLLALELLEAELEPGALQALAGLRRLLLDRVRLPPGELLRLPHSLEMLQLVRMGTPLPAAALERLPALVNVTVRDSRRVDVQPAGGLQALALEMPAVRLASALPASLRRLTVFGWDSRRPAAWAACAGLDSLVAQFAAAEALPAGWLRACRRLRVLHVVAARRLADVAPDALHGARLLRDLRLAGCALASLPPGLLDDAPALASLDLSGNRLLALPSGLFAMTKALQTLNLAKNRLTTSAFSSLTAVTSLTTLQLSSNIDLKDSCDDGSEIVRNPSPLQYLKKLNKLYLRNTSATMICSDWRSSMPLLDTLDLADNNFTVLTYEDVQFSGAVDVQVNLSGNNVTKLLYTQKNYETATGSADPSRATLLLDPTLRCDCDVYWAARALRERPHHAGLQRASCAGAGPLRRAPLDELVCAAPRLCAGLPRCACARRDTEGGPAGGPAGGPLGGPAAPPAVLLRVTCSSAGVSRVADVLSRVVANAHAERDAFAWQLHFAHNRIDMLDYSDLPTHLSILDLRYNNLSTIDAGVASALLADDERRVWLAHNPLQCACAAAATLTVLRARRSALADYDDLTCHDRSPLANATLEPCVATTLPRAVLGGAAAALALLVAAAALLGSLAHPAVRLRLKAALHRRGWLLAEPEEDDERRFDAFVSFSHGDERFVREVLVARLEGGAAPYRLCVHYRDWAPGGWIPAQIAASVRASRRTVAVLSEHFLRSAWARAELREAYALALRDARPRLVLVLLDEPERLPLDDRLRRYLAANTYVRWGDPWFWEKLYLALPRGRGHDEVAPAQPSLVPAPAQRSPVPAPAQPSPVLAPAQLSPVLAPAQPSPAPAPAPPAPAPAPVTLPPPHCEPEPVSTPAIELDLLVKPSCGAQYSNDVTCYGAQYANDVTSCGA